MIGSISVGGFPKEQASFSRVMGYCQQEDVHVPYVSLLLLDPPHATNRRENKRLDKYIHHVE